MEAIASLTPAAAPAGPLDALEHPPAGASLVELRADLFPGLDPAHAVAACPLPLLYTLRSRAEGGGGPDEGPEREGLLKRAREAGCALLDLEAERDLALVGRLGLEPERVILSWHDPRGTPADLGTRVERLLATPVRWIKVVPTAASPEDLGHVLALHRVHNAVPAGRRRLLAFAMGPVGVPSRYLAPLLGPPLTYVAWNRRAAAAPGQLTVEDLEAVVGHLAGPPARLFGVVGRQVAGSLSPRLHGAAYRALGLPWVLLPVSVPDPSGLDGLFQPEGDTLFDGLGLPAGGWAVTSPYKREAAEAATLAAPRVRRARSANTLLLRPGGILADTTDADGVVGALLAAGTDPAGLPAVVQGTGGAGRAAAVGLDLAGARVALRGRSEEATRRIAGEIGVGFLAPDDPAPRGAVLVNATPLGSRAGDPLPFPPAEIGTAAAVVDMVYGPGAGALQAAAEAAGVLHVDGLEMLLHQGIAQIAAFTGRVPPREELRRALDAARTLPAAENG